MPYEQTTLAALCREQDNPYFEVSLANGTTAAYSKTLKKILSYDYIKTPYVYCGLVEDVHVLSRSSVISRNRDFVISCQSYQNLQNGIYHQSLTNLVKEIDESLFSKYIEEECIYLGGAFWEPPFNDVTVSHAVNFGHFIFEYLNRMAIFEMSGVDTSLPVVVHSTIPERWLEFLELVGVSRDKIIKISPYDDFHAFRKVWVSSSPHYRDAQGFFRVWGAGIHWLRNKVLQATGAPQVNKRRRVYLGRGNVDWRRIVNEDQVTSTLAKYGFEFPDMMKLSAKEQIELVSGAEIIVIVVGAGSAITQFAPESCINILLSAPKLGLGPWGSITGAVTLGQIHHRVECELEHSSGERPSRLNSSGVDELADISVNIDEMEEAVLTAIQFNTAEQIGDASKLG